MSQPQTSLMGGELWRVDDNGWLFKAVQAVKDGRAYAVGISGPGVMDIISHVRSQSDVISKLPFIKQVAEGMLKVPDVAAGLPVSLLVGGFASLGAVGGMVGSLAVLTAAAHLRGMTVAVAAIMPPGFNVVADGSVQVMVFPVSAS